MSFLRPLESFIGMFQCLPGVLVSGLVIFFPMVRGGGAVCVCGVFVEFGSSLVRFTWHSFSPILGGRSHSTYNNSVFQAVRLWTFVARGRAEKR